MGSARDPHCLARFGESEKKPAMNEVLLSREAMEPCQGEGGLGADSPRCFCVLPKAFSCIDLCGACEEDT